MAARTTAGHHCRDSSLFSQPDYIGFWLFRAGKALVNNQISNGKIPFGYFSFSILVLCMLSWLPETLWQVRMSVVQKTYGFEICWSSCKSSHMYNCLPANCIMFIEGLTTVKLYMRWNYTQWTGNHSKTSKQNETSLYCLASDVCWQILMSHWTLLQVTLGIPWTNIFAIMKVYHMTQKPCTTVTREPRGHFLLKTGLCTWTSMHMEGRFKYSHMLSSSLIHSLCVFQLNYILCCLILVFFQLCVNITLQLWKQKQLYRINVRGVTW